MSEWASYIKSTKNGPPNELLIKAVPYVTTGKLALDLGAGALCDSKYLAKQGFMVMAVDSAPEMMQIKSNETLARTDMTYKEYFKSFHPDERFDLINAQWALSFEKPEDFDKLLDNIYKSLKKGGIFTGNIYANRHSWAFTRNGMTFWDMFTYTTFLIRWKVLYSKEKEYIEAPAAGGHPINWHIFEFILRK